MALAPDLYHGQKVQPGEPDEAGKAMMAMKMDQAARDMSGAVDELLRRSSGDRVGVIGFCMGGGLALVLATQRPDAVAAVVPCYGIIPWPDAQPDYSAMSAAVLGHYAEKDDFFTPEAATRWPTSCAPWASRSRSSSTPTRTTRSSTTRVPRCTTPRRRARCGIARWSSSGHSSPDASADAVRGAVAGRARAVASGQGRGARLLPSSHVCTLT